MNGCPGRNCCPRTWSSRAAPSPLPGYRRCTRESGAPAPAGSSTSWLWRPHRGHALAAQPHPVQSPTVVLLQAATCDLGRVDVEHVAPLAVYQNRVTVDVGPVVVDRNPHQAAAVQGAADIGERGYPVLSAH